MIEIPRFITHRSIVEEPFPDIRWLTNPLISAEDKTIIYGEWGTYKTWLLLDLALHLSASKDWLGHFPIPTAKRVLYIDEEMSEITLRRRLKQLTLWQIWNMRIYH